MKEPHKEVMSLVELQKFLADELAEVEPTGHFARAFTPLTDGLGLESPKKKEPTIGKPLTPKHAPQPAKRTPLPDPTALLSDLPSTLTGLREIEDNEEFPPPDPLIRPKPSISHIPESRPEPTRKTFAQAQAELPKMKPTPPPVPSASGFRRGLAAMLDLVFVVGLSALVIFISNKTTGKVVEITSTAFLKFAILEYATIALCYFAFGIGILDVTLGMWVWGLRVTYGPSKGFRKFVRIFLSFLFFAPVAPSLILAIRIKGKNLLDVLSGTSLYRTNV